MTLSRRKSIIRLLLCTTRKLCNATELTLRFEYFQAPDIESAVAKIIYIQFLSGRDLLLRLILANHR